MRFELIHHGVTDSTSERAFAAITSGTARHGDVHLASAQTQGRGRFGRTWFSPPGEGLYMSIVLLPAPPPWNPSALTMAAGLAVFDAARGLGVAKCALKWPNDLIVDEAKLAGVLVETRGLDPAAPHYVVGIGLNVHQEIFPYELVAERAVTSLSRLGVSASIESATSKLLAAFAQRMEEVEHRPDIIARDYLGASRLDAGPITVRVGGTQHTGQLVELSLEHGLVLQSSAAEANEVAGETRIPLEFVREIRRV